MGVPGRPSRAAHRAGALSVHPAADRGDHPRHSGGRADARAGRPPYLYGLLFHAAHRWEYLRTSLAAIRDIVAIGIILDAVAQFLIFRQIHPGAALVVGPVLITTPYALARALSNRWARRRAAGTAGSAPAEA